MSFYGDFAEDGENLLNLQDRGDFNPEAKLDMKPLSLKIKAKSGASELKVACDVKAKGALAQKAELKFPGKDPEHSVTVKANDKEQEICCSLAPKQLLKGDGKTDLDFTLKHEKDSVSFETNLAAGGYNLAGLFPYSSVNITANMAKADKKVECEAKWSENFKYDKFHVGFENEFDQVTATGEGRKYKYLKEANALLGYESPVGLIWSRIACFNGDYSLMWMQEQSKTVQTAAQVHFNKNKQTANILGGLPINLRLAFAKKFSNGVKATWQFRFGENLVIADTLELPLSKSLKCTLKQETNIQDLMKSPGTAVKLPGIQLDLKL